MGHCEMLLAVAGLKPKEVKTVTLRLAGDWSDFPSKERAALNFTRKHATDPSTITDDDVKGLESECGKEMAWQVIWYASSRHYMTTVADSFQLPLEKENPFTEMPGVKKAK